MACPTPITITDEETKKLFYKWNDAVANRDSEAVAKRYAKTAVHLPTVSDTPLTDFDSIKDYFDHFLALEPRGEILESYTATGPGWCEDVGIYEFTLGTDGSKVRARYTFVYVHEDGEWKIAHHHSSKMPEEEEKKQQCSEAAFRATAAAAASPPARKLGERINSRTSCIF